MSLADFREDDARKCIRDASFALAKLDHMLWADVGLTTHAKVVAINSLAALARRAEKIRADRLAAMLRESGAPYPARQ